MEKEKYTFEDWVSQDLLTAKDSNGNEVKNDSENYLKLITTGKLSRREFIKIRNAQRDTYDFIIDRYIRYAANEFKQKASQSLDLERFIEIKLNIIANYSSEYGSVYREVISPRRARDLKLGAKHILPEEYLAYQKNKLLPKTIQRLSSIPEFTHKQKGVWSPTQDYWPEKGDNYQIMEAAILWYKWLEQYQKTYKQTGPIENKSNKSECYIKPELLVRLNEVESKMSPIIESWGTGNQGTKIKCAAFVELLMEKSFFKLEYKQNKIKSCVAFAKHRYNAKISTQMLTKEKQNRHKHQILFEKYFK